MRFVVIFAVIVLLASTVVVSAQNDKVDFSGEWVLNTDKSDTGQGPGGRRGGMSAFKLIINQKENQLVVQAFRENRKGEEITTELTYALDGEKSENTTLFGTQVSKVRWSKDGQSLHISSTLTMSRGEREFTMESDETWTLDKGTLIIETTRSTPRGEMKSKAVYDSVEKTKIEKK